MVGAAEKVVEVPAHMLEVPPLMAMFTAGVMDGVMLKAVALWLPITDGLLLMTLIR